jgi:uncharacterized protein
MTLLQLVVSQLQKFKAGIALFGTFFALTACGALIAGSSSFAQESEYAAPNSVSEARERCRMKDDGHACYLLGFDYQQKADHAAAYGFFRRACDLNSIYGCEQAAYSLGAGKGVKKNPVKAGQELNALCEGGYARGCYSYALSLQHGWTDIPEKDRLAIYLDHFEKACDAQVADACTSLGLMYHTSFDDRLERDFAEAKKLYEQACGLYDQDGCRLMASILVEHPGNVREANRGKQMLKTYCDEGDNDACSEYLRLVAVESPTDEERKQKLAIAEKACERGLLDECRNAAWSHMQGLATERNFEKAIALLDTGCTRGHTMSCLDAGSSYDWGVNGAPLDKALAVQYYDYGCRFGDDMACQMMSDAKKTLVAK